MIAAALALAASVAQMKGHRRVLIVAAPRADDPALRAQEQALAGWRKGADDRDVSVIQVIGDRVADTRDAAATLRRAYRLAAGAFTVVLIGKDGREAYRAPQPVGGETLQATIDAMPMRRAGLR